ncbi:unnamed protein product [Urochloa humidicola]
MEPKIGFIGITSATQSESPRVATSFALAPAPSSPFGTTSTLDLGRETGSSSQSVRVMHDELSEKEAKMQWIKKGNLRHQRMVVYMRSVHHDDVFHGLFDHVFVDKKWFCITGKNRNCSPKVLILTAIAQPRFDSDGNCTFDGKIGCFPFVTYEVAKRSSVNWPARKIEMKPIDPVKDEAIRDFMIEKVLPAIRAKWPVEDANKPIFIQQDNARPHLSPNDKFFCEAAKQDGFDIKLLCQPEYSPNLSVLDLGLFNSSQSIQYKRVEEIVATVHQAFEGYSVHEAKRIFLAHGHIKEAMKGKGASVCKNCDAQLMM